METRAEVLTAIAADDNLINKIDMDTRLKMILDRCHPGVTLTVGAEATNEIPITIQLTKADGSNYASATVIRCWVSDAAAGTECTTAPNGGLDVDTGTSLIIHTADKHVECITTSDGTAVIGLTDSGTPTFYLNVEINGEIYSSDAVTFA